MMPAPSKLTAAGWPRRISPRDRKNVGLLECPVCASAELEYAFVVDKYPVCQCRSCSLLFLNPQPPQTATERSRSEYSEAPVTPEPQLIFERLLGYSEIEVRDVLLVESGPGLLENEARARGLRQTSVTPENVTALLQGRGGQAFDACVIHGSLERSARPDEVLLAVRELLRPSGSLLITTASIDSTAARLLRNRWWEFSSRNYYYFGVNTLQNLLLKTGFREPLVYTRHTGQSSDRRPQPRWERWRGGIASKLLSGLGKVNRRLIKGRMRRYVDSQLTILARRKNPLATPKLSVIVPAYNEKATFCEVIEAVLAKQIENLDIEVIIVESNSNDGTREDVLKYATHPRVRVVLEDRARGKGHAVRAGLQLATGDVILIQDADLEYDINEYESLIFPIFNYEQNFVIGSRHNGLEQTWKIRQFSDSPFLSHVFNFGHLFFLTLFNRLYHQNLADPFSMFKVFRRDCLYGLEFECNRFDFDHELVIKLIRKGYRPIEIPINYRSRSLAEGKKVTLVRDPLTWLRALLKFRASPLYRREH
jgi:hypothetical protein